MRLTSQDGLMKVAPLVAAFLSLLLLVVHVLTYAGLGELGLVAGRSLAIALLGLAVILYSLQRQRMPAPLGLKKRINFLPGWALGLVGLGLVHALIEWTGGVVYSPLYPLVYLHLAICFGLLDKKSSLAMALIALAFEVALFLVDGGPSLATLISHGAFMAIFASLFAVLLIREVRAVRKTRDRVVRAALRAVEEDAKEFRLTGATETSLRSKKRPPEIETTRKIGSVLAIREGLCDVLEVARLAVHADAAMLFMLSEDRSRLKLKGVVARAGEPAVVDRPVSATEGALGAVLKTRRSVNLKPRDGSKGLGYRTRTDVGSFIGVPVERDGQMLGVLAVDRKSLESFNEADEKVLSTIARHVQRAIESERIFSAMDRLKYEQERFHEAFSLLNEALTVDVFAERLLQAAKGIKPFDFAAVTLFDEAEQTHTIVAIQGRSDIQPGTTFLAGDGGLVSMALKNGQALPFLPLSEQLDRGKVQIFGGTISAPALRSVKVFPLTLRALPLGTLVVGSTRIDEVTRAEQRMIETVVAHGATTLANARMYKRMEMMATTDGLTGLVNHRRFKELLEEALARAERFSRKVSVLMVDADHFKTINDTYGHPVGDVVLKRIAKILGQEARRTDVVARYGGEEFVLVLDETEQKGAHQVAERIRQRIEAEVIQGEFGRVRVTASLGLCTWPDQSKNMHDLLERADQALYEAKHKGRNQVGVWNSSPRVQA